MYNQYQNNNYQQQPQYGAPPAQQYGAPPPQQYGAPQQGYGAPPQPAIGQYNSQPGWGAPPPPQQQHYQAPPQQLYAPPPVPQNYPGQQQQQQQWGAPPPPPMGNNSGPRYLGVAIPAPPPAVPLSNLPGYNPQFDAERIRKATKGFGTDEKTLIDTLAPLDPYQMDVISRTYEQMVGRSLKVTLEKELSGWLEYTLVLLSLGPLGGDIYLLHRACQGAGTHEDLLTEVLLGRSNEEIWLLKEGYKRVYNRDLVAVVRGELSMKTERMFNMALSGSRDESPYVNHQLVQQDVEALYRAGAGKIGTDEIAVCGILLSRSDAHLAALAQAYPQRHRHSLSQMIHSEFSGHMRDSLAFIALGAETDGQGVNRDVDMIEAAMAGAGTKDERLIYRIVRAHWNRPRFGAIKNTYSQRYRSTLRRRVEGETSGKYERALVAVIEQI